MAVFFRGMTPAETVALTESMMRTGEVLDLSDAPGPQGGQALHGRRGRQDEPDPGPPGRRLRRVRADDLRPRPRPHRGHARQAGVHPRLPRRACRWTSSAPCSRRAKLGLIGQTPQIAPADRKLYALRDVTATVESRPAHRRLHHEQEDGGGHRRAGAGREDRRRRVHEDDRGLARAGPGHGRDRPRDGQEGGRAHHRHGAAAGARGGQRARGRGVAWRRCAGQGPQDLEELSVELAAWMLHLGRGRAAGRRAGAGPRGAALGRRAGASSAR